MYIYNILYIHIIPQVSTPHSNKGKEISKDDSHHRRESPAATTEESTGLPLIPR